MATLRYGLCPNGNGEAFKRYVEDRIPTGGFLNAVLENDLKEACARADVVNQQCLFGIVAWLYNEAPATCWGSRARVSAWLNRQERNDE